MTNEYEPLSPQGQARREAMLDELIGAMSRRQRHRRIRRIAISTVSLAMLFVLIFRYADSRTDLPVVTSIEPHPALRSDPIQSLLQTVVLVQTDPTVSDRFRGSPPSIIEAIDDVQLVTVLGEIGRPAGLIRFGDRLALSAVVTDEELGQQDSR